MFETYVVTSRSVRNGMSRAGPPYAPASRSTSSTGSLTTTVLTVSRKATDSSWANPTSGLPPMNTRRRTWIRLAGVAAGQVSLCDDLHPGVPTEVDVVLVAADQCLLVWGDRVVVVDRPMHPDRGADRREVEPAGLHHPALPLPQFGDRRDHVPDGGVRVGDLDQLEPGPQGAVAYGPVELGPPQRARRR